MTIAGVRAALDRVVVVSVLFVAYAVRDVIRAVKKYNARVHERLRRRRRALSDESAQQGRCRG